MSAGAAPPAAPLDARAALARAVAEAADDAALVAAAARVQAEGGALPGLLRYLHLFLGFPRVIRALNLLHAAGLLPSKDASAPAPTKSPAASAPPAGDGEARFRHLYGEDAEPVLRRLAELDPLFRDWILEHAYGRTGDGHDLELPLAERLAVLALAATGCWAQCRSHLRGALRHGVAAATLRADVPAGGWLDAAARARLHELIDAEGAAAG